MCLSPFQNISPFLSSFFHRYQKILGTIDTNNNKVRSCQTQENINSITTAVALSISKTAIYLNQYEKEEDPF